MMRAVLVSSVGLRAHDDRHGKQARGARVEKGDPVAVWMVPTYEDSRSRTKKDAERKAQRIFNHYLRAPAVELSNEINA